MTSAHILSAFAAAVPYRLGALQHYAGGTIRAEIKRGAVTCGWCVWDADGELRLEGWPARELPAEVLRALARLQAAGPDRRGAVLASGGGYVPWEGQRLNQRRKTRGTGERNSRDLRRGVGR